ncbi:MAG: response regulator [Hespellia sp.]|nr:response regulator [Hespellia sp.]
MYNYIIVDDEPLIRMGTLKKLEPLSTQIHCVGEADNGEQAVSLVEHFSVDIVILDMEMPIMDGTQLLAHLSENYPDLLLIVISGYKSFDYVKSAISANVIDYILKPFTENQIQQIVLRAIQKLDSSELMHDQIRLSEEQKELAYYEYDIQLLQNLILGYPVSDTAINSNRLSFLRHSQRLYLAAVYCSQTLEAMNLQEPLRDLGFSEMTFYLPHPKNEQIGFLILCMPDDVSFSEKSFYVKVIESLMNSIDSLHALSYWGISSPCSSVEELHEAYKKCSCALNAIAVNETTSHYYIWHPEIETEITEILWDKKDEFLFRIEAGMSSEVNRLLDELKEHQALEPRLTLADLKYYYHQLVEECLFILKQYLTNTGFSRSMSNIVNETFSAEELQQYYRQFFVNLSEMLKPQSVYAIDDTIEQVKIYAQRNYNKNLSMDFLASLFYMNSSYLSHLFRKKTGEKFAQYLNAIRIEKAKVLLASTDRKLYQITKSVGYDNTKYFFRVFKKYEGMTPEQYRLACSKQSS